jgi:hypothetical protein
MEERHAGMEVFDAPLTVMRAATGPGSRKPGAGQHSDDYETRRAEYLHPGVPFLP